MIAYRVEIWCDGREGQMRCDAGTRDGTFHDDHLSLPNLASNLAEIYVKKGWTVRAGKHYCPKHSEGKEPRCETSRR